VLPRRSELMLLPREWRIFEDFTDDFVFVVVGVAVRDFVVRLVLLRKGDGSVIVDMGELGTLEIEPPV